MYVIYALIDPRDYSVHYVGQTTDVYQRFAQHLNANSSSFLKNAWIMELRALNRMVIMETLEEVSTYQLAVEREAYWIKHFEMLKEPLANVTHRASVRRVKKDQMKAARYAATRVLAAIETRRTTEPTRPTEYRPRSTPLTVEEGLEITNKRKEAILAAMKSLKSESKPLTLNAIAKRAELSWHFYDEIEEVAIWAGYDLDRGQGRPAKDGGRA